MIRTVTKIGDPILRQPAREVTADEIAAGAVRTLVDDMIETMHHEGGIGIAAPQVGEPVRVAVIEFDPDSERYRDMGQCALTVFVNPVVTVLDDEEQAFWEGCLSVPDLRGVVPRPRKVRVDYVDLDGQPQSMVGEDFIATVLQHELDHLDGILFVDRVRDTRLLATVDEYEKHWLSAGDDEAAEG